MKTNSHCDLAVIGSGPAGEMAAVQAGFLGKRVVLIEKEPLLGGAATNTGTIPSKTLRETALFIAGFRQRSLYGLNLEMAPERLTAREFLYRERHVAEQERAKIRRRLDDRGVEIVTGTAILADAHTIQVSGGEQVVSAAVILIATGSRPFCPPMFPATGKRIHDSNSILNLEQLPASMTVVGAGVIGCEYASIFASLGVEVTVVHGQNTVLPFLDAEIQQNLESAMGAAGIRFLKPDRALAVEETADHVTLTLDQAGEIAAECVLIATGRASNTEGLGLESAGIETGERGLIKVNAHYQTSVPHIYAAGDVIGFPALASTSIEQARIAMDHAFRPEEEREVASVMPYGIYTIPECAMAGETEEQLRARGAAYVVGHANYRDNARGLIVGEEFGLLKLLFDRETRVLLGVHLIGEQATELVHLGLLGLRAGANADLFLKTCFNYPTLSELYKHATYDAFGKPAIE